MGEDNCAGHNFWGLPAPVSLSILTLLLASSAFPCLKRDVTACVRGSLRDVQKGADRRDVCGGDCALRRARVSLLRAHPHALCHTLQLQGA